MLLLTATLERCRQPVESPLKAQDRIARALIFAVFKDALHAMGRVHLNHSLYLLGGPPHGQQVTEAKAAGRQRLL